MDAKIQGLQQEQQVLLIAEPSLQFLETVAIMDMDAPSSIPFLILHPFPHLLALLLPPLPLPFLISGGKLPLSWYPPPQVEKETFTFIPSSLFIYFFLSLILGLTM